MNNKVNIIQIVDSLDIGGTEVMSINIANELLNYNLGSHICTTRKNGSLLKNKKKEVGHICLDRNSFFSIKAVNKLKKYITKNNISIAHVHSTSIFFMILIKFYIPSIKLIWHNHTGANTQIKAAQIKFWLFKGALFFYKKIINVNDDLYKWTLSFIKKQNTTSLYNFPILTNSKHTTLKYPNTIKIVIVAALRPEKNHLGLLKIFKRLNKNIDNISLHIVGKGNNDNLEKELRNFLHKNKLEDKVVFYGARDDIGYILEQADIGVLNSLSEGLPVSLLEYGIKALPVITTNVGQCRLVLENKGIVVDNDDEFYRSLVYLVDNKYDRVKLGSGFKTRVDSLFSKDKYMCELIRIYKSC